MRLNEDNGGGIGGGIEGRTAGLDSNDVSAGPGPVPAGGRIRSVDVLRGAALLGILMINILSFSFPDIAIKIPTIAGGMKGVDLAAWWVGYLFFYNKCMPVFSMLFGAGLVLMLERYSKTGISFRKFWYRRVLWLLVIGLLHFYFLWIGDILYYYAICGLIIFLFRTASAKKLVLLGSIVYLIGALPPVASGFYFEHLRTGMPVIEKKLAEERTLTPREESQLKSWTGITESLQPSNEQLDKNREIYRGGYLGILKQRAPEALMMQTWILLVFIIWRVGGLMILGMGLMKVNVFSASRSGTFYAVMSIVGYGIGLPLVATGADGLIAHNFDFVYIFKMGGVFNYFGGPLVALGHVGIVMLICRSKFMERMKLMLASVGRMALSNYLSQTIVFTTIFFGYGLGLYGRFGRAALVLAVLGMWVVQLVVSPLWLGYFRFGPAEWLWRSFSYGRRQPFRIRTGVLADRGE